MPVEIPKMPEDAGRVFSLSNENEVSSIALSLYHFQFSNNPLYGAYCRSLGRTPNTVHQVSDIPFLPISFFKSHQVTTTDFEPALVFRSSGTTGQVTSSHTLRDPELYRQSFRAGFRRFYGDPAGWCILGLLPSYLERGQSSLVYMVDQLIRDSGHPSGGFYLHDTDRLRDTLEFLEERGQKTLLIGVTYALLDFARHYPMKLRHTVVMETGGMKGRNRELTRGELYGELSDAFGLKEIHSEYGMTELLSQGYAVNGLFRTPPWMRVLVRDETDPFAVSGTGPVTGALNIVDLANVWSCAFIATEDLGRLHADGSFEVLGRMDHSDVRGCSLMAV